MSTRALYAHEDSIILISIRFIRSKVMNMLISLLRSGAAITQMEH